MAVTLEAVEAYVDTPYSRDFDCADLVTLVQREMFGREVRLPNGRPRGVQGQAAIAPALHEYARPTDDPGDGDLVLMRENGRPGHVGVFFRLSHEDWVLHSNEKNGMAVLHRLRDLPIWGAEIEGIYAWVI